MNREEFEQMVQEVGLVSAVYDLYTMVDVQASRVDAMEAAAVETVDSVPEV